MEKSKRKNRGAIPFVIALVCLINPSVHVVDILPDFIAYLIIAHGIAFSAKRAPYFEEARTALSKLALLSMAKIPAFFVIVNARSQVSNDTDIYSLFAFSFAIIEAVLVYSAINNLFLGLFYLGERASAPSLISPFRISKNKNKYATPENVRFIAFVFTLFKCAAFSLPELLLLSRSMDSGSHVYVFNVASLYPYAIILFATLTVVIGIIFAVRCYKYRRTIVTSGEFIPAIESLFDERGRAALDKRLWLGNMHGVMTMATVASLFTIELIFSDFRDINLLPHTVFAVLITVAMTRLSRNVGGRNIGLILSGIAYIIASLGAYVSGFIFLTEHRYEDLVNSSAARAAYGPTVMLSWIEFGALLLFTLFAVRMLCKFSVMHTGVDPTSERYMRTDALYHKTMRNRTLVWGAFAVAAGLTKAVATQLRTTVKFIFVGIGDTLGGGTIEPIAEQIIPWFGTVVVAAALAFMAVSLHYFGTLKSDTEIKYGSD